MTTIDQGTICAYCGGCPQEGTVANDWYDDQGTAYCPGCHKIVAGDVTGLSDSVRSEFAAARTLLRACDEIDDCYRRLEGPTAAAESEPRRRTIEEVGRTLSRIGGERAMRRALVLVGADCDPDHLVTPLAGGTLMDPVRKAAVTSHKRYIEREWSGIGLWQG